jgi:hypothetical protein
MKHTLIIAALLAVAIGGCAVDDTVLGAQPNFSDSTSEAALELPDWLTGRRSPTQGELKPFAGEYKFVGCPDQRFSGVAFEAQYLPLGTPSFGAFDLVFPNGSIKISENLEFTYRSNAETPKKGFVALKQLTRTANGVRMEVDVLKWDLRLDSVGNLSIRLEKKDDRSIFGTVLGSPPDSGSMTCNLKRVPTGTLGF